MLYVKLFNIFFEYPIFYCIFIIKSDNYHYSPKLRWGVRNEEKLKKKIMKKLIFMLMMISLLLSCSIDKLDEIAVNTIETEYVSSNVEHPYGGYYVYFYTNGIITNQIFLSNGANGIDGKDGINGIDGIDGKDGVSASVWTEYVTPGTDEQYPWGGYWLYTKVGENTQRVFVSNGTDGINGINGIDGKDGKDGVSVTVRTEKTEGGYWLYVIDVTGEHKIFIENGQNGTNGLNGVNGLNGIDGKDGKDGVSVTIRTEITEGGTNLIITSFEGEYIIFIKDGSDGANGTNGTDGINGINGTNGINGIDGKDGTNASIRTQEVEGGYILYITNNNITYSVFISNGTNGTNGLNGTNGTDGINGTNGTSVTVKTEKTEDGYYLYVTDVNGTTKIFIENGTDGSNGLDGTNGLNGTNGTNGINGIDGINGTNGTSATIWTVRVDSGDSHGYWLYTQVGTIIERVFVSDGIDGTNGLDGEDGEDGEDLTNGDGTVTICHKVTHTNKDSEIWAGLDYVTLTLNLSEYIEHIYEFHNGNSTQNDSFGSCDN